ncbi:MAG TPA: hypothetical protein VGQ69_16080 [Gemmatimonadales bacterium]|jgi:uncharacterized cupredoxin-like copper-binding protein|nr:hypothetical protein [Gemmatimonadales bacterium]
MNSTPLIHWSAVALMGLAGCAKSEKAPESDQPVAVTPPTVHVTATDYSFEAPDTLPAGLTSFHLMNSGKELHHLVLVRLAEGQSVADFQASFGGPIPSTVVLIGGPNPATPEGTAEATVNLKPGKYAMFCVVPGMDGKPHIMKGMVRELTVTSSETIVTEPVADVTIKLTDYSFEISPALTAGRHTIRVEDAGSQPHELVWFKLEPGKTVEQMLHWSEKMEGPPPGTLLGGVSPISTGEANYITLDLTPGEYGLLCYVADAKDQKPHFMHGMMKQITVI